MEVQWQLNRPKSPASFGSRSFISRTLKGHYGSEQSLEDSKGPLGLTTLYAPDNATVADLIFVHGLGGGSRSTWTKSTETGSFWPQEWLPRDPGFQSTRIHTFGYNSDWDKESILNIHDFAKSLLGSIQDCPTIPRASESSLILIGHSMGGLVIKKAFILARQFQEFESIARRAKAIFFLATPHRGADLAQLLSKILQVTSGARPFVNDLHRNSLATQSINDEFPQHCQDLQLYSFYETVPMSFAMSKSLVVDKDLATLGYRNERTGYLNANHRDVCKYATVSDPNYITVRNALASVISDLRSSSLSSRTILDTEQRRLLDGLLGATDTSEDDLMIMTQRRMRGSCRWLLLKESFQAWREASNTGVYWLSAKPAAGKSVLSGYVIERIREHGSHCIFYFFRYDDQAKSTISNFLLSIAWQLAVLHPEILKVLLAICEKEGQLNKMDYRTIWRKLFLEGILKARLSHPQFLVVDAVDECKHHSELVPFLMKIAELSDVRIFVTSRNRYEWYRQSMQIRAKVTSEEISADDTKMDITKFLDANMEHLPLVEEQARQDMVAQILLKSAGCFLWVSLVLRELKQVHTAAEIQQVLEDIPSDMDDLYSRILDSMSQAPHGKKLAQAILTWTVCAARPLTTLELFHALQIDIQDSIDSVEKSIASVCGQLVYVDPQSRVQMVHLTARDFLLRVSFESEFAIEKKAGHKRLAMACLDYLNSDEMKAPRHRKLSASHISEIRCPFLTYAANSLFEHVLHVSSEDDDLLFELAKFLGSSNVLSWIEYLAQTSNLNRLIRTGRAIRNFLQRRSKHMNPLGKHVATLDAWATDLVRLVTKFGNILADSPSSIYNLIPPFCPSETAPRKQFGATSRGLAVLGLSAKAWDDCLSTLAYQRETASAVACSDRHFVVGMSSGKIAVYNEMTCQEVQTLRQQGPVRLLHFDSNGDLLISCGVKAVHIWDVNAWRQIWKFDVPKQCMALALADENRLLLGALRNNCLMIWDLTTGKLSDTEDWTHDLGGLNAHGFRSPTFAAFCVEQSFMAIIYRGQDIVLWDIESGEIYETYTKEGGSTVGERERRGAIVTVISAVFSDAPGATLLAAAYTDGDLVLFDTSEGIVKGAVLANAQTLAGSPDGRTLASGDSNGMIQIFDFETLKILYRIHSEDYGIRSLAFSTNGHHLLDIRGARCRVWDPAVLFRQDMDDEQSDTVSISTAPQEVSLRPSEDPNLITALTCYESGDAFFVGKEDGTVWLYDTKTGFQKQKLFSHAEGVAVTSVCFDEESQMLSSTDSSSRVVCHRLTRKTNTWEVTPACFDHRAGETIDQLLSNCGHTRLLVCSPKTDALYAFQETGAWLEHVVTWENRGPYRWGRHPSNRDQMILITGSTLHLYEWKTLCKLTGPDGIVLDSPLLQNHAILSMTHNFNGKLFGTTFADSLGMNAKPKLLLWNSSDVDITHQRATPVPNSQSIADRIEYLIGAYGQRLVFLHSDGWICSTDTTTFQILRHFFIPSDWLSTSGPLMIDVTRNGDVIFVKQHEVAVIKRGLDISDTGSSTSAGKRPSLALGRGRRLASPSQSRSR